MRTNACDRSDERAKPELETDRLLVYGGAPVHLDQERKRAHVQKPSPGIFFPRASDHAACALLACCRLFTLLRRLARGTAVLVDRRAVRVRLVNLDAPGIRHSSIRFPLRTEEPAGQGAALCCAWRSS